MVVGLFAIGHLGVAQVTPIGSGSYTTAFPGTDSAGRNGFPSGSPQLSGNAIGKPVPTNDWWSALIKQNHANNLFNYPLALKTVNAGLVVSYIVPASTPNGSSQPIDDALPITVGVSGLNSTQASVSDYSDWTVSMDWSNASHSFSATAGIGMPFLYFTKNATDVASVTITEGNVVIANEMLIVTNSHQGSDFAVYAPAGSIWTQSGNVYTSTLNSKNYWSMAYLPPAATDIPAIATEYKKYAYVFPEHTAATWVYDAASSKITTTFNVTTSVKEGTHTNVLLGLLPHQWANLASGSAAPNGYNYSSIRGEIKTLEGNSFSVENTFRGILPTLPYVDNYSEGFNPADLDSKIAAIENDGLSDWTDSYNEGQMMNRLIQTARIADEMGDTASRDKMVLTIKSRLEDWLKAESGEVAFLFYYNTNWSTLIGYPAGHGQDNNINDHHFHWGYFIHAAAFLEQYQPGWSAQWGPMINLMIRDAASPDRNDTLFPYLRNFSPYAGHSWANGFATFPFGNDQESTSESMQFASSLIHWGTITENDQIRDLGIYIYTTEQTAIEEYWFDVNQRTFKPGYGFSVASRIWGNGYDNQTFWTSDIAAAYGIEMYPIHGGSLYLGHNPDYAESLWDEISANTGILSNEANPNLWHDTYWQYLSFIDAPAAIDLYDSFPERGLKFGISDAQTYHWLHAMNALGRVNTAITANYPIAASFTQNGETIYVAHNYSDSALTVTYSDGFTLEVPANELVTSLDIAANGVLSADFYQAYPGGSVNLTAVVNGSGITKVEFFDNGISIGADLTAPYEIAATDLTPGIHGMYAKVYVGEQFSMTNTISVQVGEQVPFLGTAFAVPGTIQAGNYDAFEGGIGQNISYSDASANNEGNYRPNEQVDAATDTQEGPTVGWISAGEWLEYTIDVQNSGLYDLNLRYASGNTNGGGPFHLEIDGVAISPNVSLATTGDWETWIDKNVLGIPLTQGSHVLRFVAVGGEFNLGEMEFAFAAPLGFVPPVANAGANVVVVLPDTSATMDGSLSSAPDGQTLTYAWEQIYGPSVIVFDDAGSVSPIVSNLTQGVYKLLLTVSDGNYTDTDEVLILVSQTGNAAPSVSITSPANGSSYVEGAPVSIAASATDLDGSITVVEFFAAAVKIGEDTTSPYNFEWLGAGIGNHEITAVATDNGGIQSTSAGINISVSAVMSCSESSNVAQQGSFSSGYIATFETVGTTVTVTFELLDTDKVGVVAYLWQQTPFTESPMDAVSGLTFSKTLSGQTPGTSLSYAVKFAYAGGLSVTQYINYVVGDNCDSTPDIEAPLDFTASVGTITATSIEIILNGTDDSGTVMYTITYGTTTVSVSGASGVASVILINNLTPESAYSFSVSATDPSNNPAANNAIALQAVTLPNSNTVCSGISSEAQQAAFSIGYEYDFQTVGTDVIVTFKLLDTDKTGVVAYLWQQTPFTELPMTNVSGLTFSRTLSNQVSGSSMNLAVKFAFAGGLAVTRYFTYTVGEDCAMGVEETDFTASVKLYPNPASEIVNIDSPLLPITKVEMFSILGNKIWEGAQNTIQVEHLPSGIYLLKIYAGKASVIKKLIID